MSRGKPLIIILGPTASGKSELAVFLAKKINGEIISADSRQIYRGLDIGTGKVPGKWLKKGGARKFFYKNIPHHCIDFVSPKKIFSIAQFKQCSDKAIKEIYQRGKIPIIAGGTGFWIDAVAYNFHLPEVPPNERLRKILSQKSAAELFEILKKLDPKRSGTIESKNPRRLIRAIEIAKKLGKVPPLIKDSPYNLLWIGIDVPKNELSKKISARLKKRMKEGMLKEAIRLHKKGLSWKRFYELGLEYKFLADFLRKKNTKKEMETTLEHAINDYARRQTVWFKKNKNIKWIKDKKETLKLAKKFLIKRDSIPLVRNQK